MSNPVGRPPKYKTPEEMQDAIDTYFDKDAYYEEDGKRVYCPTVSGLAYHLGMSTEALRNYEEKDEFLVTVKSAKQKVEMFLERRLQHNAAAGTIFNLKNNFSWKDKQEVENTGNMRVHIDNADADTL